MRAPYNRGGLRFYLMLAGLLAGYASPTSIAWGTPLLFIGIAMHIWAKGCLHQNRQVTMGGPYRFVRHPFYFGNAFLDVGIGVMSGWWPLLLVLPFWWLAVYLPTMHREEAAMVELFGDEYRRYRERVPLVIPSRRPLPKPSTGFYWLNSNLLRTEIPRALRFLAYPCLFFISYRIHSYGATPLFSPSLLDVSAVTACVSLYAMAKMWGRHFRGLLPILPAWAIRDSFRLAILIGVIIVGASITGFEVENEWATWLPGIMLLGLSIMARTVWAHEPAIAEALLAIGLAVAFELVWLATLLLPFYLGIVLDKRLFDTSAAIPQEPPLRLSPASVSGYSLLLLGGVALSVAKELWLYR